MPETPSSETISTKQQRIATLAKQSPELALTTLSHYLDLDWLREAYRRTRKDGAVGVDGQTAREYEQNLEASYVRFFARGYETESYCDSSVKGSKGASWRMATGLAPNAVALKAV